MINQREPCPCAWCVYHRYDTPIQRARSILYGQRWTKAEAEELQNLIEIGATPPREVRPDHR